MNHRLHDDIGSSLLELALVLPMLMLTMIGAAELGRIAYAAIEVSNAARAGAAYGSLSLVTAKDSPGIKNAAQNEAANISSISFPTSPTIACVCEHMNVNTGAVSTTAINGPCYNGQNGQGATSALSQCQPSTTTGVVNNLVHYVQVSTQATVDTMFKFNWNGKGLPSSFTLNGYAQMRMEQD